MKKVKSMTLCDVWYSKQNGVETWTVEYKGDYNNFDTFEDAMDAADELCGLNAIKSEVTAVLRPVKQNH